MPSKSSQSVIAAFSTFAAEHRLIRGFTFWDIEKIKSDAGTEFTSREFEQFCPDKRVAVSFAPPKHQEGNHFAESLRKLAQCMLVHARLHDMYLYHALLKHAMCLTFCLLRIW
jgi:transposase InsO family protein